jgi:cytochrome b involved in lipid metabolism
MFSRRLLQGNATRLVRYWSSATSGAGGAVAWVAVAAHSQDAKQSWHMGAAAVTVALAGIVSSLALASHTADCDCENPAPRGHPASALPQITYDCFKDDSRENIWVTMDGGVYDVTAFLDAHPGGTSR